MKKKKKSTQIYRNKRKHLNTKTVTIQNKRQPIIPNQREKEREHENNELERTFEANCLTLRIYFRI